jgi:ATP-dependent helicase STH1/SNF2
LLPLCFHSIYKLVHSDPEKITAQPSLLAGGDLKDYQLLGLQWLVTLYNKGFHGILADEMV